MVNSGSRLSAGAVIVRETSAGYRFLMLRAFRHWDFPKGMVEPVESPLEAAVREVGEETTITDLEFPWGDPFIETGPYNRGKIARYYLALTRCATVSLPVNPEIGRPEHSEYRWVCRQGALDLASPRVARVVDWATDRMGPEDTRPA